MIDWDQFEEWVEIVEEKPGYEFLDNVDWEGARDNRIDWDMAKQTIESKKYMIEPEDFAIWLKQNEDRIDWDEFQAWADYVESENGYEWLNEAIESYESGEYENRNRNALERREREQREREREERERDGRSYEPTRDRQQDR